MMRELENELKNKRERLVSITKSLVEGLLEVNAEGLVIWSNGHAEKYLDRANESFVGYNIQEVAAYFQPPAMDMVNAVESAANGLKDQPSTGKSTILPGGPASKCLHLFWSASPLQYSDGRRGAVVMVSDVTKVTELETKLAKQRADFVSALKHRMRTPVVAAIRICKLLQEEEYGPLTERQKEIMSACLTEHCDLLQLLDVMEDIYNYQNNSKDLFMAPVSVSSLIDELNCEFDKQCGAKTLSCTVEGDDLSFFGDRIEVHRLLWNLLDNAIEYGGASIKLDVKRLDHLIAFSVEDNGSGISPADIEWLFDRFYEVSSNGRYSAKTGTGLCLCAQIARAHEGTISCESKPGQGTKFTVTIPSHADTRQERK